MSKNDFSHLEDKRLGRNKCLQMDCSASALMEPSLTHQFAKMHTFCRLSEIYTIQSTTSIRRQGEGAYCKAAVGGKCMASKGKLVLLCIAMIVMGKGPFF